MVNGGMMRDPTIKMITWTNGRGSAGSKPLSEAEERFCQMVVEGHTYYDSAIESGMLSKDLDKKTVVTKCANFMKTLRARKYFAENGKTLKIMTEKDYDIVRTHMYEIAMGTATKTSIKIDKEGNEHPVVETPSFRDQIAAAGWLAADLKTKTALQMRTPAQEIIIDSIDEIEKKANDLVSKYSYRPVARDGVMARRAFGIENRAVIDATVDVPEFVPDDRTGAERIEMALKEELSGYSL